MNIVQIKGLFLNFIVYLIMIIPIIIVSLNKKNYSTKKKFLSTLICCTILEIIFSLILYLFPEKIFSVFTNTTGIINFAVYASKILFISSSLFAIKITVPTYLRINKNKKITILVLSKIVITITSCIAFYFLFSTKGFLFSFPICDFLFYVIYFLEVIR